MYISIFNILSPVIAVALSG